VNVLMNFWFQKAGKGEGLTTWVCCIYFHEGFRCMGLTNERKYRNTKNKAQFLPE
jgi:hypothetical protein